MDAAPKPLLPGWQARIDDQGWPEMAPNRGSFTRLESIRHDAPARALRFRFGGKEREYEYPAVMAVLTGMFRSEDALVTRLDALAGDL